jgi:hypothetical protein
MEGSLRIILTHGTQLHPFQLFKFSSYMEIYKLPTSIQCWSYRGQFTWFWQSCIICNTTRFPNFPQTPFHPLHTQFLKGFQWFDRCCDKHKPYLWPLPIQRCEFRQCLLHRDFCIATSRCIEGICGIWHWYHSQHWKFLTPVLASIPRSVNVSAIGMLVEVPA